MKQLDIFLHQWDNNPISQSILDNNKVHLNKKCLETLELLKSGIRLTVRSALLDYGISSLPRRILDLKEKGIDVKSELINGRFKIYFL